MPTTGDGNYSVRNAAINKNKCNSEIRIYQSEDNITINRLCSKQTHKNSVILKVYDNSIILKVYSNRQDREGVNLFGWIGLT